MEKLLIYSIVSLLFFTCSSSKPSMVTIKQVSITAEKTLQMTPGWIQGTELQLALDNPDTTEKNTLILSAILPGTCTNFADENIIFTINKEQYFYAPSESVSQCKNNMNAERHDIIRTYEVPIPFIRKLLSAKEVTVSLNYAEGSFSKKGFKTAKVGFKEYLAILQP